MPSRLQDAFARGKAERRALFVGYVTGGYRLDHIFASENFQPVACGYLHETRASGLSDHSAIVAEVEGSRA